MAEDKKYNIIEFEELESTNARAKELAGQGAAAWTVVTAIRQTGGYGRKGNIWVSPAGGLYFSAVLPKSNVADLQILTILAAFCAAKTIKDNYGVEPFVKLPNDVYINGKKVCGALTENVILGDEILSVIGIGVNTNVETFAGESAGATSLKIESGQTIDNRALLEQIIEQLKNVFKEISN